MEAVTPIAPDPYEGENLHLIDLNGADVEEEEDINPLADDDSLEDGEAPREPDSDSEIHSSDDQVIRLDNEDYSLDESEEENDDGVWFGDDDYFDRIGNDEENIPPELQEIGQSHDIDYWLSKDEIYELQRAYRDPGAPKVRDWKIDDSAITITVNKSRRTLWEQAKREVEIFRANLKHQGQPDNVETLFLKLFGPMSRTAFFFMRQLNTNFRNYSRFLATFFLTAQLRCSINTLCENPVIKSSPLFKKLMDEKEYKGIWRKLKEPLADEQQQLWMEYEDCFNADMKELFLPRTREAARNFVYRLALDDDKLYYAFGIHTDTKGAKRKRHTQANVNGFTNHVCALAALAIPIRSGIERERDTGDTCYKRLLIGLFGDRTGDGKPDLQRKEFDSDRGYWTAALVAWVLACGGDIGGTLKRMPLCPFTYGKKQSAVDDPDKPENVQEKGFKDGLFKTVQKKTPDGVDIHLTSIAYRFNGNIALMISSKYHGRQWEFATKDAADAKWYFDSSLSDAERFMRGFPLLVSDDTAVLPGEDDESVNEDATNLEGIEKADYLLLSRIVVPLTVAQGTVEWFLNRGFSFTSSTTDKLIRASASAVGPSHPYRADYETILKYTGLEKLLATDSNLDCENGDAEDEITETNEFAEDVEYEFPAEVVEWETMGSSSPAVEDTDEVIVGFPSVRIEDPTQDPEEAGMAVLDPEERPSMSRSPFRAPQLSHDDRLAHVWIAHAKTVTKEELELDAEILEIRLTPSVIRAILLAIGKTPPQNPSSCRKFLNKWIDADPFERPYIFLQKAALLQAAKERRLIISQQSTIPLIVDLLAKEDARIAKEQEEQEQQEVARISEIAQDEFPDQPFVEPDDEMTPPPHPVLVGCSHPADESIQQEQEEIPGRDEINRYDEAGAAAAEDLEAEMQADPKIWVAVMQDQHPDEIIPGDLLLLSSDFIRDVLICIGKTNPPTSPASRLNLLAKWIGTERHRRLYILKTKQELLDIALSRRLSVPGQINIPTLIDVLLKSDEDRLDEENEPLSSDVDVDPLLLKVLQATFLKPQKKVDNQYTRKGHEMEEPYLKKFFEDSLEGKTCGIKVQRIRCAGLAQMKTHKHVRFSLDGCGFFEDEKDWVDKLLVCECKGRVAATTYKRERRLLQRFVGADYDDNEVVYHRFNAFDPKVSCFIPSNHETFQLLHLAYCCKADVGVLLVGSNVGLMHGVFVDFPSELKEAYGRIIEFLFERTLKWAYGSLEDVPVDEIMLALQTKPLKDMLIDRSAFMTHFLLWRYLNVDEDPHKPKFPLPACSRLVPRVTQYWNVTKGAGDTTTDLCDKGEARIGIKDPGNAIVVRMLEQYGVVFHRGNQILTAHEDMSYPSLVHFRDANNRRKPLHTSLVDLFSLLQEQADVADGEEEQHALSACPPASSFHAPPHPERRHTRGVASVRSMLAPTESFGATPKRGRARGNGTSAVAMRAYKQRAEECLGFPFMQKKKDDAETDNTKDMLNGCCAICNSPKIASFCFGCRRYLCFSKVRIGRIHNENAHTCKFRIPSLDAGGRPDVTETGSIKYLTEYGLRSCYQIAHEKKWHKHTEEMLQAPNMMQRLLSITEEIDEEDGGYHSE
jgi:hypothetical protein